MEHDIQRARQCADKIVDYTCRVRDKWRKTRRVSPDKIAEKIADHAEEIIDLCDQWLQSNAGAPRSKEKDDMMRISDMIYAAGAAGLTKNELTRRTQGMTATARQKAIEVLLTGNIRAEVIATRTTPKTIYYGAVLDGDC